jgi:transposase
MMRYEVTDRGHQADVAEQGARRASWTIGASSTASAGCCDPAHHGAICRFVRWRRAGVWGRIMDALAAAHDAAVQMIDTSIVRVHQHVATRYDKLRSSSSRQ